MDCGVWRATVHGVAKSRIRQSNFTFTKKQEAPHTTQGHVGSTTVHHGLRGWEEPGNAWA